MENAPMDEWEQRIRTKVHAAGILTPGEWTYLVGVFAAAREYDDAQKSGAALNASSSALPDDRPEISEKTVAR